MNDEKDDKKKKDGFVIGGWHISYKMVTLAIVVIAIIFISSKIDESKEKKEAEAAAAERQAEIDARLNELNNISNNDYSVDMDAVLQERYRELYGNPPDGFEWDAIGNLIALSDESTCEEVVYTFLRSLSMLDFSIAEKYSIGSEVISDYKDYYGVSSQAITDYYDNFLRKQYSKSLASLAVNGVESSSIFADGTQYMTVNVSVLDLTDKDFWQKDRDSLFSTMRVYRDTETDDIKMEQYVYDYIYDCYSNNVIGKRTCSIDLVCTKSNGGGWLVSNDKELCAVLSYENGVDVAAYILDEFETWYINVTLQDKLNNLG